MAKKHYTHVSLIQGDKITQEEYNSLTREEKYEYEEIAKATKSNTTFKEDLEV